MQVFQTAGTPPSSGKTIFPIMGWTPNDKAALRKSVAENKTVRRCPFRRSGRISINYMLAHNLPLLQPDYEWNCDYG
jgi:hypothetical protein